MKEISNSDLSNILSVLHGCLDFTDDSTKEKRELRRKSKLLLRKMERKFNLNNEKQ